MSSVRLAAEREIPGDGVLCMALAHNEMRRVEDFLRHYRGLGVAHFLMLDDNSTDGTTRHLREQGDVTLFAPDGTTYREHKVAWRSDILDAHATGRWVLVPDLDELFVYPHCDTRPVAALAAHLEREGAEALFTPMVEMYGEAPLDRPVYQPGQSMLATYPFFDSGGYRLVRPRFKQLAAFPTPALDMYGSPRERMFYDFCADRLTGPRGWAVRRFAHLRRSMAPGRLERAGNTLARFALSGKAPRPPLGDEQDRHAEMAQGSAFLRWPACGVGGDAALRPLGRAPAFQVHGPARRGQLPGGAPAACRRRAPLQEAGGEGRLHPLGDVRRLPPLYELAGS